MKESQTSRFCRCIKKVKKTVKLRKGTKNNKNNKNSKKTERERESAAIGICVKSVLQRKLGPKSRGKSRGRTLRRFSCKKGQVLTQPLL